MPIPIRAPTGDIVNFPDGTSVAVIEAAMSEKYPRTNAAAPRQRTLIGAVGEGVVNAGGTILRGIQEIPNLPENVSAATSTAVQGISNFARNPVPYLKAAGEGIQQAAGDAGNYVGKELAADWAAQHPELSSALLNGGAPPPSTLRQDIYGQIAEHPISTAVGAVPIARPLIAIAKPAIFKVAPYIPVLKTVTGAKRNKLIVALKGRATQELSARERAASAAAPAAQAELDAAKQAIQEGQASVENLQPRVDRSGRILGERVGGLKQEVQTSAGNQAAAKTADAQRVLEERSTAGQAAARIQQQIEENSKLAEELKARRAQNQAPFISGEPRSMTESGQALRGSADAQKAALDAQKVSRDAVEEMAQSGERYGVELDSSPAFREAEEFTAPFNKVTASEIEQSRDPNRINLFKRIHNILVDRKVPLTAKEAAESRALGNTVEEVTGKDGKISYERTFKTSFNALDEGRRFLGEVFSGNPPRGYEGINAADERKLYSLFDRMQDDYSKAAEKAAGAAGETTSWRAMQQNYTDAFKAREVLKTPAGKALTGKISGTEIPSTPAMNVPSRIFEGGPEAVQHAIDLKTPSSILEAEGLQHYDRLFDGKNLEQINKVLRGPQGEALNHSALSGLKRTIDDYKIRLGDAERMGVEVEGLAEQAKVLTKSKADVLKQATDAPIEAARLKDQAIAYKQLVNDIANESNSGALKKARNHFAKMNANGIMDDAAYKKISRVIDGIEKRNLNTDKFKSSLSAAVKRTEEAQSRLSKAESVGMEANKIRLDRILLESEKDPLKAFGMTRTHVLKAAESLPAKEQQAVVNQIRAIELEIKRTGNVRAGFAKAWRYAKMGALAGAAGAGAGAAGYGASRYIIP